MFEPVVVPSSTIETYRDSQLAVNDSRARGLDSSDQNQMMGIKRVEQQSIDFLNNYVKGLVVLADDAYKPEYNSSEPAIISFFKSLGGYSDKETKNLLRQAKEKFKKENATRNDEIKDRLVSARELCANNYAILNNKKEMAKYSSEKLLIIAHQLMSEKNYKKSKAWAKLQGFVQYKIQRTFKREIPTDEKFSELVKLMGTGEQINRLDTWNSSYVPIFEKNKNSDDKPQTEEKRKNEKVRRKSSERNGFLRRIKYAALAAVAVLGTTAASVLGVKSFKQSQSSDEKAQTALNVNNVSSVSSSDENTNDKQANENALDFQKERQKVEQQKVTNVQPSSLSKEDKELALRIEAFKFSQEKLGINLNSLDEVVASQIKAGNIEISDSLSLTRAKYVVAFYAQFPGTQAGKTCKALLDGKKVSLDKDTFNKWNQNLGKHGGKFTMTLRGKKVKLKNFSAMDYYKNNHKTQH